MSYEEFLAALRAAGLRCEKVLSVEWTTGGDQGTDCWGKDYGKFDPEPEPPLTDLDDALAAVCPNISALQIRRLENSCVHRSATQRDDYYGVHEHLGIKRVYLKELYSWLCDNGLLPAPTPPEPTK